MTDEGPQHRVTIARPFAVSKFDVTFDDWDACVSVGGCPQEGRAGDAGWGRDTQPVIYVSWDDAQPYVAWLSQDDRQRLPAALRSRMGIRGSCRHHDGLLLGRRDRQEQRQLLPAAAANGTTGKPHRSDHSSPMRSASTTWPATCGNGCRIAGMRTTTGRPPIARRGRQGIASVMSSAAVPGATFPWTPARPTVTETSPSTGTTISASGSRGHSYRAFDRVDRHQSQQRFHRDLPFFGILLRLGQLRDVCGGIASALGGSGRAAPQGGSPGLTRSRASSFS